MAATRQVTPIELRVYEFISSPGANLREFVLPTKRTEANVSTPVTPACSDDFAIRRAYCTATRCGVDFDDASMSGTMRWPNSHTFQWLPAPSKAFCRLFGSWEITGWKQYLIQRRLCAVQDQDPWTLSKSGRFPAALNVAACGPSETRDLLRCFGPSAAELAVAKKRPGAAAHDSRTAAAAAARPQSLDTPSGPVQYRVSLLDGLSLPLTVAHAARSIGWRAATPPSAPSDITVIMAGASRRAEQRIAACTPYLRELALGLRCGGDGDAVAPASSISVLLVGPEVAPTTQQDESRGHAWTAVPSYAASGEEDMPGSPLVRFACVQDTLHGLLQRSWGWGDRKGSGLLEGAHCGNTLIVTVNPGYGNLFSSLTNAWLPSLHAALRSRCVMLGLCANHDADALGEHALLQRGFPGSVQQLAAARRSPFGSMSTWVGDAGDKQAAATEKRAQQLAAAMQCSLVGDSNAYAGQSYWYAVRGKHTLSVAPEMRAAAAFRTDTAADAASK